MCRQLPTVAKRFILLVSAVTAIMSLLLQSIILSSSLPPLHTCLEWKVNILWSQRTRETTRRRRSKVRRSSRTDDGFPAIICVYQNQNKAIPTPQSGPFRCLLARRLLRDLPGWYIASLPQFTPRRFSDPVKVCPPWVNTFHALFLLLMKLNDFFSQTQVLVRVR